MRKKWRGKNGEKYSGIQKRGGINEMEGSDGFDGF